MTSQEKPTEAAAASTSGWLSKVVRRLVMKQARVVSCERPADRFRLVTLGGAALRDVTWSPGSKMQIAMASAFTTRTYTPIDWDPAAGRTRILGYAHGDGPGSAWLLGLKPGDPCEFIGPRTSLDVSRLEDPLVLFGDETSMGLAYALAQSRPIACYFEVGDIASVRQIATLLGIENSVLIARRAEDLHLKEMEAALAAHCASTASFVLSGKASTIQRLRQGLKLHAIPSARIASKAYWAPGKTGLD